MKSITEFFAHKLKKGLDAKKALEAEGKTPEEIDQQIGESMKFEGEKLKHFTNSMGVASENFDKLTRVLVVSVGESEQAPPKAIKLDEFYYIPEYQKEVTANVPAKTLKDAKGGRQKSGKREGGPKSSPWGLSPEEIAAKKSGGKGKSAPN